MVSLVTALQLFSWHFHQLLCEYEAFCLKYNVFSFLLYQLRKYNNNKLTITFRFFNQFVHVFESI